MSSPFQACRLYTWAICLATSLSNIIDMKYRVAINQYALGLCAGVQAQLEDAEGKAARQAVHKTELEDSVSSLKGLHSSLQQQVKAQAAKLLEQQARCTELQADIVSSTAREDALQERLAQKHDDEQQLQLQLQGQP